MVEPAPCGWIAERADGVVLRTSHVSGSGRPLAPALDDSVFPESGDLLGGIAELAKDLVRVLAVRGRGAANRAGRARERRRKALDPHLAAFGMGHRLGHP